jgi:plasmid stability protein
MPERSLPMAQILVRNLKPKVVARLKKRARAGGRSLESEVREILEEATQVDMETARKLADRIRAGLGRRFSDSTALVREDRDR